MFFNSCHLTPDSLSWARTINCATPLSMFNIHLSKKGKKTSRFILLDSSLSQKMNWDGFERCPSEKGTISSLPNCIDSVPWLECVLNRLCSDAIQVVILEAKIRNFFCS